jgi:hypothetical protein
LSPNCIDIERIAELSVLPESHELRRHADECPRCRSLLLSYRSFMEASATPGADVVSARRALEATIRSHARDPFPAAMPPAARRKRGGFRAMLFRPAPALAMAAVLVIAAIALWPRGDTETPVLRGESASRALELHAPEASGTGVHFSWSPFAGADSYEVLLFDDTLAEVHRATAAGTEYFLDPRAAGLAAGTRLTWRVVARHGGDAIATSSPGSVTLP